MYYAAAEYGWHMGRLTDAQGDELVDLERTLFAGAHTAVSAEQHARWNELRRLRDLPEPPLVPASDVPEPVAADDEQPDAAETPRARLPWAWAALGAGVVLVVAAIGFVAGGGLAPATTFAPKPDRIVAAQPFDAEVAGISANLPDAEFLLTYDADSGVPGQILEPSAMFITDSYVLVLGHDSAGALCLQAFPVASENAAFTNSSCVWEPLTPVIFTYDFEADDPATQEWDGLTFRMEARSNGTLAIWILEQQS